MKCIICFDIILVIDFGKERQFAFMFFEMEISQLTTAKLELELKRNRVASILLYVRFLTYYYQNIWGLHFSATLNSHYTVVTTHIWIMVPSGNPFQSLSSYHRVVVIQAIPHKIQFLATLVFSTFSKNGPKWPIFGVEAPKILKMLGDLAKIRPFLQKMKILLHENA